MRALHLPGLPSDNNPPFSYPLPSPTPSALIYTASGYNAANVQSYAFEHPHPHRQPRYLVRVSHTALTRGELTWEETLRPPRFSGQGGAIPGHDLVGAIAEIYHPSEVDDGGAASAEKAAPSFKMGDRVCALLAFARDGAAAEYASAEAEELAHAPVGVTDEELATIPLSGLSAWQALFEHGGLRESTLDDSHHGAGPGKKMRVLVTGASGSVGVMAVQIAKAAGCWVVGTCSERNVGFVRDELGADEVVDYTKVPSLVQGFEGRGLEQVDLVVDAVGGRALVEAMDSKVAKDGARVVSLAMPLKVAGTGAEDAGRAFEARGGKFAFFVVRPDGGQLTRLMEHVEARRVRGFVDRVTGLSRGGEAMAYVESGRARGKVVLKVN
ncbi:MAG: hypothetical protein LQ338_007969 [Usnochroma carphineum]|nr:MAG: hypothetical protein LQ338_007969 [Usnochroma carphineum]